MTAKEYLQQIYIISKKITRLRQLAERLRSEAYSVDSPMGSMSPDKVQTSFSSDKMERMIARMDKTDRHIRAEQNRLKEQSLKIQQQIEALKDERYRSILFSRYVLCKTWEKVAEDVPCDVRHVYRLHGDALKAFVDLYADDIKSCH